MTREISHSEVSAALDCQLRHAFAYTGRVTGGTALKPRVAHLRLREGRAWGRAVAAWHETGAGDLALEALDAALVEDAAELEAAGAYDAAEHAKTRAHLTGILVHYGLTAERLEGYHGQETEAVARVPSRTGKRGSNRYRLRAYFDGRWRDRGGNVWLVEHKLRGTLTPLDRVLRDRQVRWYAWAAREALGVTPVGALVDERLNAAPGAVVLNKPDKEGRRAPRKGQAACTPEAYLEAAAAAGIAPDEQTLEGLRSKRWQVRHEVLFAPGELDEAGAQIASAARLVADLDSGRLYPVRNPSPMRCPGCAFRDVCTAHDDDGLIDMLFDRVPPKRERVEEGVATS